MYMHYTIVLTRFRVNIEVFGDEGCRKEPNTLMSLSSPPVLIAERMKWISATLLSHHAHTHTHTPVIQEVNYFSSSERNLIVFCSQKIIDSTNFPSGLQRKDHNSRLIRCRIALRIIVFLNLTKYI